MTKPQLVERFIRNIVREELSNKKQIVFEQKSDIKKINMSNLATNAQNVLNSFVKGGFKGVYDPESADGSVEYKGLKIDFSTGGENLYLTFSSEIHTKDTPEQTISELKKFLDFVSNNS